MAAAARCGAWSTSSQTISTARAYAGVTVDGDQLYVTGGCSAGATTCTTTESDILYATFGTSGDLTGAFTTNSTGLPSARGMHGFVVSNGYAYVVGGRNGTTFITDSQFAPINSNGFIGSWTTGQGFLETDEMAAAMGVVTYGGYMYLLGGFTIPMASEVYANYSQSALLNNGGKGTTGTWTASSTYTTGRTLHETLVYNGYIYVLGGYDGSNRLADVQYAPINSDGTIGTWASTTSFSGVRGSFASAIYNGYMYIFGGRDSGSSLVDDVQYAPINSNGTVGTWATTTVLPTTRSGHRAVAYKNYMYLVGGVQSSPYDTVHYAPINSNGTLGSWTATTSFTTARSEHGIAINNGYMYVIGGMDASSNYLRDTQYAPINSNGTIGTWTTTTSMNVIKGHISPVVANGFMYLFGGYDGTNSLDKTEYAPINSDGTLGIWQTAPSISGTRYGHRTAYYNGYLYLTGGFSSSTYTNTTQYAPVKTLPRTAQYSKMFDLGAIYTLSSISYNGTLLDGLAAINYKAAGTNGVFGSLQSSSSIVGGVGCSAGNTRYIWAHITMDDSSMTAFPETGSTYSTVTDLTINYSPGRPATNTRLSHGKYFADQALQPLDTCTP